MRLSNSTSLRDHWFPVAEVADVDPGPVAVTLLSQPLVLYRVEGTLVAAPDRCPHREAPLSLGTVTDSGLACAYHGWQFGAGGACIAIPSSGERAAIPPAAHLSCVQVTERYGLVWVSLGNPAPAAGIPVIDHDSDPAFRRINTGVEVWRAAATRMVDNFLDVSHFPWVHAGTFGTGQAAEVARIDLVDLDDWFHGYGYEVDAANPDGAAATTGSDEDVVHRWMSTGFCLPLLVRSTIRYAHGLEHILLLCSTPIDEVTSYFTFVVWRNDDFDVDPEIAIAFSRAIGAEDKVMLERIPGPLPTGRTDLVSVRSDRPSVEWRRRFLELLETDG